MPHCIVKCSSMPHLSRYYTLYVIVRGVRIWPPNAAKCCKNAGKFFPNVVGSGIDTLYCARFLIGGAFDPFVVPPCMYLAKRGSRDLRKLLWMAQPPPTNTS